MSTQPPPPLDMVVETARLHALKSYRILDQHDIEGLERLAEHAATAFGAEAGAVSFVDAERVWFAGGYGLARPDVARANSFCDAVIRSHTPLLVPDALDDPRFWEHELVQSDRVRSFAGAALIDEGGYALGAISVMSQRAGAFAPPTLDDLTALSRIVQGFLGESRSARSAGSNLVQGWLGVRTLGAKRSEATAATGAAPTSGLVVLSVARGSPAEQAGLRPTDIIQSIDEHILFERGDIVRALAGRERGAWAHLRYRRAGQWCDADVQIVPIPRAVRAVST